MTTTDVAWWVWKITFPFGSCPFSCLAQQKYYGTVYFSSSSLASTKERIRAYYTSFDRAWDTYLCMWPIPIRDRAGPAFIHGVWRSLAIQTCCLILFFGSQHSLFLLHCYKNIGVLLICFSPICYLVLISLINSYVSRSMQALGDRQQKQGERTAVFLLHSVWFDNSHPAPHALISSHLISPTAPQKTWFSKITAPSKIGNWTGHWGYSYYVELYYGHLLLFPREHRGESIINTRNGLIEKRISKEDRENMRSRCTTYY